MALLRPSSTAGRKRAAFSSTGCIYFNAQIWAQLLWFGHHAAGPGHDRWRLHIIASTSEPHSPLVHAAAIFRSSPPAGTRMHTAADAATTFQQSQPASTRLHTHAHARSTQQPHCHGRASAALLPALRPPVAITSGHVMAPAACGMERSPRRWHDGLYYTTYHTHITPHIAPYITPYTTRILPQARAKPYTSTGKLPLGIRPDPRLSRRDVIADETEPTRRTRRRRRRKQPGRRRRRRYSKIWRKKRRKKPG